MGLGHRFDEFLEAANRLGPSGPLWAFAGGGPRKMEIAEKVKSFPKARIQLLDYVTQSQLREHLCAANVHLASLDSAWQGLMVPSKVQGSFAVGRPVLYVGGRQCETAVWIEQSGGGWVVDQGDVNALLLAVQQASNPEERRKRGQAALNFARKHFNRTATCNRMAELLEGSSAYSQSARDLRSDLPAYEHAQIPACNNGITAQPTKA
jgi:glycosyltransferase involved in cell wall biosynthesis